MEFGRHSEENNLVNGCSGTRSDKSHLQQQVRLLQKKSTVSVQSPWFQNFVGISLRRLWCFSELFFLKFLLIVTNMQLCAVSHLSFTWHNLSHHLLISTDMSLYSCFQLSIHGNKFQIILSLSSCMAYITTFTLPFSVMLLCQEDFFFSNFFLSSFPIKAELICCYI